jgi:hypothetical protein
VSNLITTDADSQSEYGDMVGKPDQQLLDMINELIGQSNDNYLQSLIASVKRNGEEAWDRFNEGYELDTTIDRLMLMHQMSSIFAQRRHEMH